MKTMKSVLMYALPLLTAVACSDTGRPSRGGLHTEPDPTPAEVSAIRAQRERMAKEYDEYRSRLEKEPELQRARTPHPQQPRARVEDLAACTAADRSWRCAGYPPKTSLAIGGTRPPIIPSSWTVPEWDLDPANATAAASDNNTCTSSAAPCLTWAEIVARWGTVSPWLAQNTIIKVLSTQPSNGETDPVVFKPYIRNNAAVQIQGQLNATTQHSTGTITVAQAKSRSLSHGLLVTYSGATTANDLIVNATHSSNAMLFVGGASALTAQPLSGTQTPTVLPTEVDTWTTGDTYTAYTLAGLNIVELDPTISDESTSPLIVSQLNILSAGPTPPLSGSFEIVKVNGPVLLADSVFNRKVVSNNTNGYPALRFTDAAIITNAQITAYPPTSTQAAGPTVNGNGDWIASTQPQIFGGYFFDQSATSETAFNNVWIDYDAILEQGGIGAQFSGVNLYGCVAFQSSAFMVLYSGYTYGTTRGACGTNPIFWTVAGTATIYLNGQSTLSYGQNGGNTATNVFLGVNLRLNSRSNTGCSHNLAAPDVIDCGITISDANLDAAQGVAGFGGYAFIPGGATITNSL